MAKDGTMRGGARIGSGKKKQTQITILPTEVPINSEEQKIKTDFDINFHSPTYNPGKYLSAKQPDGKRLRAKDIYRQTYQWLESVHCEKLISPQLLEQYSLASARFIQAEEAITQYGMIGKHPTTDATIRSPFVGISIDYMKQATQLWFQIFQIVKENGALTANAAADLDPMEQLLRKQG